MSGGWLASSDIEPLLPKARRKLGTSHFLAQSELREHSKISPGCRRECSFHLELMGGMTSPRSGVGMYCMDEHAYGLAPESMLPTVDAGARGLTVGGDCCGPAV
jgi:hypothetical protein